MTPEMIEELNNQSSDYKPESPILPNLDTVPDGAYECEIGMADLTRAASGDLVCNLHLRMQGATGVFACKYTLWLSNPKSRNRSGYDMISLGFPEFKDTKQFGTNMARAVPRMVGLKFYAQKTSRIYQDKPYHDLLIVGVKKSSDRTPAPATPTPPAPTRPAQTPAVRLGDQMPHSQEDEIPF